MSIHEELNECPLEAGFTMPAETSVHECCWMGWPVLPLAWRGEHDDAKAAIARLANLISGCEPVRLLVPDDLKSEARRLCSSSVDLVTMDIDDGWLRDSGPTFVKNGSGGLAVVDWEFNGWGDMEFAEWHKDAKVASRIADLLSLPLYRPGIVNEGGAIHVDGEGTVLCTRPTILDPCRNPELSEAEASEVLCESLGCSRVLWLDKGYEQDETKGHIDIVASFVSPGKVMHLDCDDPSDPNYRVFKKNISDLESMTDAMGRQIEVIRVPQPTTFFEGDRRLDLSHQNYYPANGAIVLPRFDTAEDEAAREIFSREFPDREILWFDDPHILFHGGGGIHCLTQQQPSADP